MDKKKASQENSKINKSINESERKKYLYNLKNQIFYLKLQKHLNKGLGGFLSGKKRTIKKLISIFSKDSIISIEEDKKNE